MTHYKKYFILFVDDEPNALKYFEKAFSQYFNIMTAENAAEGWEVIQNRQNEIGILMTDQRMPGEPGVKLLEKVRKSYPKIIRILVTAYADLDSAIEAVNSGSIYKYISKPWDINELQITLMRAFDFFMVQNERDHLVQEKMSVIQRMCMANQEKNLACLAAGVAPFLKNSLQAVQQFIELNPVPKEDENSWRNMENWAKSEVENVSYMLTKIRRACGGGPFSSNMLSINFYQLVEKVNSIITNGINFRSKLDSGLPEIQLDENQIIQLIELLVENINIVSDSPSQIDFAARLIKNPQGIELIQMEFSDNLPTWSEEQKNQFYSLRTETETVNNPGLNFLTSLLIVHNHNGEIEISTSGEQKVIVRIPVSAVPMQPDDSHLETKILHRILSNEKNWKYF